MQKKIIFIIRNLEVGGIETSLIKLVNLLPLYDITLLITHDDTSLLHQIKRKVNVIYSPVTDYGLFSKALKSLIRFKDVKNSVCYIVLRLLQGIVNKPFMAREYVLKQAVKLEEVYDTAIVYDGGMRNTTLLAVNHLKASKKIMWVHEEYKIENKKKLRIYLRYFLQFHKIFCVSRSAKDSFTAVFPELLPKTDILYNLINKEVIWKSYVPQENVYNYNGCRILSVGRLHPLKGQLLLPYVTNKLKKSGYVFRWYLVGEGPSRPELEKLIKKYEIEEELILLGNKINPYSYFHECDFYVQPSFTEGFCITLLEAMCFNKPIVTADFLTAREFVEDNETGIIVDCNSESIYRGIKGLMDSRDKTARLVDNLKQMDLNTYSEIDKLVNVIEGPEKQGDKMNILFYANGNSENHGCEAITRSCFQMLSGKNHHIVISTQKMKAERKYGTSELGNYLEYPYTRQVSLPGKVINKLTGALLKKRLFRGRYRYKLLVKQLDTIEVGISIGGDNYCYSDQDWLIRHNRIIRDRGIKTVLWGCSLSEEALDSKEVQADIRGFSLIMARESITYDALIQRGITGNTRLYPDPAFTLESIQLELPEGFIENETIGINVSPLVQMLEHAPGIIYNSYLNLVRYILEHTAYQVALIPHVVWQSSNDLEPLKRLHREFCDTGRVVLIRDHDCRVLKGFISRCRMFMGARTHATIAAYSTCVPTLVLGYSVKSRGIAKDIFGTYENHVLPVQALRSEDDLIKAFIWLSKHEDEIRKHLKQCMPAYISRAWGAADEIRKLVEKSQV